MGRSTGEISDRTDRNIKHNQYKITYKTNVLDIIRLVENNTPALWEKEQNNFPNTWGGVNALTKQVVKDLKELAGFIRYIVECPNTIRYSEYKRSLIGKTVKDVIFESEQLDQYQYAHLSQVNDC